MQRSDRTTWHILTGEYPPDVGGVSDYTATVAHELVKSGDEVHVWTSGTSGTRRGAVTVHRVFGSFSGSGLAAGARLLDAHPGNGRVLVQWVPHAFARRGVNLRFPLWLYSRSVRRDQPVDVMVHEPFMPFEGSLQRQGAAAAQRVMTATVLRAATRAFAGTPAWIEACRPLAARTPFAWTAIPTGIPVTATAAEADAFRRALGAPVDAPLIGCFGRAGEFQEAVLDELGRLLLDARSPAQVLMIGLGSEATRARLVTRRPALAPMLHATGAVDHAQVSGALTACDVMLQPFIAGVCGRHSSVSALLAHGCAIATNSGRFTEPDWIESRAVALSRGAEPAAIAAAAIALLGDLAERRRLSKAARQLYATRFDVRHTIAALRA